MSMNLRAILFYPNLMTENVFRANVAALEVQGCKTQDWDPKQVHFREQKLDL